MMEHKHVYENLQALFFYPVQYLGPIVQEVYNCQLCSWNERLTEFVLNFNDKFVY